ncbi:MAG: hypothetical protein ACJARP_002812 [Vicingaceae bacterium]|jgi:hypothetical protein
MAGNQTASLIIPISDSTDFLTYHTDSLNYLFKLDRFGDIIWKRGYLFIRRGEKFLNIVETKSDYLLYSDSSSLLKLDNVDDTNGLITSINSGFFDVTPDLNV